MCFVPLLEHCPSFFSCGIKMSAKEMDEVVFSKGTAQGKRFKAVFKNKGKKVKTIQFGDANAVGRTYIDGADKKVRDNYIARHRVREDWTRPDTAGTLAKIIIWETPDLDQNISIFKKRFDLK